MPDPIIDNLNATGKPWWKSKTIWGLIGAAVSIFAPKYQPIAEILPPVVDQVATAFWLLFALYGRIRAEKPINSVIPK